MSLQNPRVDRFQRNEKLEVLLKEVNGYLANCQEEVGRQYSKPRFPLLLLMGVPRSGTTLFMQWLADSQQWGYPTNMISRFYGAPYLGARIQQILIENDYMGEISDFKKPDPFASILGKTQGALSPHEFWYFWRRFFRLQTDADIVSAQELAHVDVHKLNRELASLEAALEKPLAMKAMLLNWHIPYVDSIFDKVLFVILKRDPMYIVQSLLESRVKFWGSEEVWYSFRPPEYTWLKELSPVEQVAGQTYFVRKEIDKGAAQVDPSRTLTIQYEEFCRRPAATWAALVEKMAGLGYSLNSNYSGPEHFESGNVIRSSPERWEKIRQALHDAATQHLGRG